MLSFGRLDAQKGWTKQLHLGASRSANTRKLEQLGPGTGFDSMGDWNQIAPADRGWTSCSPTRWKSSSRRHARDFLFPRADTSFSEDRLPTRVDNGPSRYYGVSGNQWRGFNEAEDVAGPAFDSDHRQPPHHEAGHLARAYLARRFPVLKDAR